MPDRTDLHAKLVALRDDLNARLLERETTIEAALLALLTREHLLLLGPPGTAKSMLVRSVCAHIAGTTYFERLLTRFSTPEELFGPLSLSALEQDRYQRVTKGSIVEAHIAFIDEVFKANSAILNSLLGLMNERIYHEAGCAIGTSLLSLLGASNETPEDTSLAALYDRFLLRVTVPYLADDESLRRLFTLVPAAPAATITLDELRQAQDEVGATPLSDDAREAIIAIKHGLEQEGVAASDRRWQACARLVKARAWLAGEPETAADHCDILVHALWTEPAHLRVVERVVSKIANPLNLEAVELEDAAKDLYDQRPQVDNPNLTQALEPLLRQLGDIHTRLEQRIAAVPAQRTHRARQALGKIETWHRALSQLALQSLSRLHMAPGAGA
jgi:MoxR-like ATPase